VFLEDYLVDGEAVEGWVGGEDGFGEGGFAGAWEELVWEGIGEEVQVPAIPQVMSTTGRLSGGLRWIRRFRMSFKTASMLGISDVLEL
jgi:hypothetical protein